MKFVILFLTVIFYLYIYTTDPFQYFFVTYNTSNNNTNITLLFSNLRTRWSFEGKTRRLTPNNMA